MKYKNKKHISGVIIILGIVLLCVLLPSIPQEDVVVYACPECGEYYLEDETVVGNVWINTTTTYPGGVIVYSNITEMVHLCPVDGTVLERIENP